MVTNMILPVWVPVHLELNADFSRRKANAFVIIPAWIPVHLGTECRSSRRAANALNP